MKVHTDLSGAHWVKSSYSQAGGECVEVAQLAQGVGVRDSKNAAGPALIFEADEWVAFLRQFRPSS